MRFLFLFFYVRSTDPNDHGKLCGISYARPTEVLLLPENRALLGATGTAAGRSSRRRGGQHVIRGGAHQRTDEEFHQHISHRVGRVRPVLFVVCIHHIIRELPVDRGRRLLHLLEVVSVWIVAHRRCQ